MKNLMGGEGYFLDINLGDFVYGFEIFSDCITTKLTAIFLPDQEKTVLYDGPNILNFLLKYECSESSILNMDLIKYFTLILTPLEK
jgi:hypothetical protein